MAKSNPFAGGGDDDVDTDKRVKNMQRAAKEADERDDSPEEEEDENAPEEFEVGGGKDDDTDDDDDEPKQSRKDRRRQRGEDMVRVERERSERLERELAQLRQTQSEIITRVLPPPQQRQDPEAARLEQEAKDLRASQKALVERYQQMQVDAQRNKVPLSPDAHAKMQQEADELHDRIARNQFQRFAPRQQGQQMSEQQVIAAANRARLMQEHADVVGNQRASMMFRANWMKRLARQEPDDWDTLGKAMDDTRRELGMAPKGGRPAPSSNAKRKYTGVSRGGSGGDDGRVTVKMDKDMKAMADVAYSHIKDPKKRYQHYVNRVGAKTAKRA